MEGSTLRNLRYILENEPNFPDCAKSWIVNRIVDGEAEREIISVLNGHGQTYLRIPFDSASFSRRRTTAMPAPPQRHYSHQRAALFAERNRIRYVAPINTARNLALWEGRRRAEWILPFDGGCFLSADSWQDIVDYVSQNATVRYVVVPMFRLASNGRTDNKLRRCADRDEPQVMFHREATERFDSRLAYGRRDKAELLYRLGVPGGWDRWRSDPWDLPLRRAANADASVGQAGWVFRLSSGHDEFDLGKGAGVQRDRARQAALLDLLRRLDSRVSTKAPG
jgi:hypothetical protein